MTTIPSRLAQTTRLSSSPAQARSRVIQLYREWYRSAPEIISLYGLNVSPGLFRQRIREQFESNRYVSDPCIIDRLIFKGRQEYQETMNCWKQEPHVLGLLLRSREQRQGSFLERFYKGKDHEGIIPAVDPMGTGL